MSSETKDHINPAHYKSLLEIRDGADNHTDTIQWLEGLQYKPYWRNNMRAFVQAVLDLCADKYLSRLGMKDDEKQEMQKALWYSKFATAIMMNNLRPVRVVDVDRILDPKPAVAMRIVKQLELPADALTQAGFSEDDVTAYEAIKNG